VRSKKELAYAARDAQIGGFEWLEAFPATSVARSA